MKTHHSPMKTVLCLSAIALSLMAACSKPAASSPEADSSSGAVKSGISADFAAHLDIGAEDLTIVSADSFGKEIQSGLQSIIALVEPNLDEDEEVLRILNRLPGTLEDCGVLSLTGYGRSIRREKDGAYVMKTYFRGGKDAKLWDLVETESPAPVEFLPEGAALAMASSSDPRALLDIAEIVAGIDPDVKRQFNRALREIRDETDVDVRKTLSSLRPGVFAAVTLHPTRTLPLPDIAPRFKIPEPGLIVGIRVENDDLFNRVRSLLEEAGADTKIERLDGGNLGFCIPVPNDDIPPRLLRPTLRYLPKDKMLLLASTPDVADAAISAAKGKGRLVDSDDYRKLAKGLTDKGGLAWLSPRVAQLLRRFLDEIPKDDDDMEIVQSLLADMPDPWWVSRTVRDGQGMASVAHTSIMAPVSLRLLSHMLGANAGVAALGLFGGVTFPAISGAMDSANATKIATQGKNIATCIMAENLSREASGEGTIWPGDRYTIYNPDTGSVVRRVTPSTYTTSSEYFDDLLANNVVEPLQIGLFAGAGVPLPGGDESLSDGYGQYNVWSCISVQGGTVSGDPPFLFTRNLALTDEDIQEALRGEVEYWGDKVDWNEKPFGNERVVIVTRGGSARQLRAYELTPEIFFGDAKFSDPSSVHVLPAH